MYGTLVHSAIAQLGREDLLGYLLGYGAVCQI